jgi:hypothetical protein
MNRKTIRRLGTAVFLTVGLLAATGCERSQPGPKPISSGLEDSADGNPPARAVGPVLQGPTA